MGRLFFFNGLFVVERFLVSINFEEIFYFCFYGSYFLYETLNLKLRKRWSLVIIQSQLVQVSLSFLVVYHFLVGKTHEKCETWCFMFLNYTVYIFLFFFNFWWVQFSGICSSLLQATGGRPPHDTGGTIGRGSRLGRLVASAGSIRGGVGELPEVTW